MVFLQRGKGDDVKKDKIYVKRQQTETYYLGTINGKDFGLLESTNDGWQFDNGQGAGNGNLTKAEQDKVIEYIRDNVMRL
jgi:hypothetical protein